MVQPSSYAIKTVSAPLRRLRPRSCGQVEPNSIVGDDEDELPVRSEELQPHTVGAGMFHDIKEQLACYLIYEHA